MAKVPSRDRLIASFAEFAPEVARSIGPNLPAVPQLWIASAMLGPTAGLRRLSGALPSGFGIQSPRVPEFLNSLVQETPPPGPYSPDDIADNLAFRQAFRVPSFLPTVDIVTEYALRSLPPRVLLMQAAQMWSDANPSHRVLRYIPESRMGELADPDELRNTNLVFVDGLSETYVHHDVIEARRGEDGVLLGIDHEEEYAYAQTQSPAEVARLEAVWERAGEVALGHNASVQAIAEIADELSGRMY